MKNSISILLPFLLLVQLNAQNISDKDYIIKQTNVNVLNEIAKKHQQVQVQNKNKNVPDILIKEDGAKKFFSHFESDGTPIYYELENESSAISTKIDEIRIGGNSGLDLDGSGINIGLWDAGNPRSTHQELDGKITITDIATVASHATHVSGILVASGIVPEAKGMAPAATIESFTSADWLSEIATWAAAGGMITNHSYIIANPAEDYELYGIYNTYSKNWDLLSYNAPYLFMVTGASNNGSKGYNPDGSRYDR